MTVQLEIAHTYVTTVNVFNCPSEWTLIGHTYTHYLGLLIYSAIVITCSCACVPLHCHRVVLGTRARIVLTITRAIPPDGYFVLGG